jgi:ribosomal protein L37AE/L43A
MTQLIHPDDGRVYECPDCGETGDLYERQRNDTVACYACGARFDAPVEREGIDAGRPYDNDTGLPTGLADRIKDTITDLREVRE